MSPSFNSPLPIRPSSTSSTSSLINSLHLLLCVFWCQWFETTTLPVLKLTRIRGHLFVATCKSTIAIMFSCPNNHRLPSHRKVGESTSNFTCPFAPRSGRLVKLTGTPEARQKRCTIGLLWAVQANALFLHRLHKRCSKFSSQQAPLDQPS